MAPMEGALAGVHVLDLTDERGIYGAKLLADLGADVVRPEPPDGDPLRHRGPRLDAAPPGQQSLWHAYFATNRRFFALDVDTADGREQLDALVNRADILLTCTGAFAVDSLDLVDVQKRRPSLVIIDVSSFGPDGPWRDWLAPDLVAGALGGAAATTGDADTPPLKLFGELNFMVAGAYTAIAALAALHHVRTTGTGQRVAVSVQQSIASCLEHVLMWVWYHELMPTADGPVMPRRGSLHWSNAYDVMQAKGGSIMITPTPNAEAQLMWLIEEDAFEDLIDPKYQDPENGMLMVNRMMDVLRAWAAEQEVEDLFFRAQERHSPYGWVLPIEKVADNPQLEARGWWQEYTIGDQTVRGPGAPYQLSATPWRLEPCGGIGDATDAVLAELGWNNDQDTTENNS